MHALLRPLLGLLLCGWAPVHAQTLIAHGTVVNHFGTPLPGARIAITSYDISPGVSGGAERPWQCPGVRPLSGATSAGADGRFRVQLPLGAAPRAITCLEIVTTPPASTGLSPLFLTMDSVQAGKLAAAGDSVLMDIMVPDAPGAAPARPVPLPPPPAFRSQDEELLWLAKAVPGGFGGYWRAAGAPEVQVYLTDVAAAPQAKRLLMEYFKLRPPAGGAPGDVLFMRGRYDVPALIGFRDRLRAGGAGAGVRAAVLRLDWNRVQVTVVSGGRGRLLASLRRLGVPQQALFLVGGR